MDLLPMRAGGPDSPAAGDGFTAGVVKSHRFGGGTGGVAPLPLIGDGARAIGGDGS